MSVSERRASFASLFGFIIFFSSIFRPLFADADSRKTPPPLPNAGDIATSSNQSPPPPPPFKPDGSAIKPSVAVIVGVLTTIFSLTFLLLLYAKHCKRGGGGAVVVYSGSGGDLHNSREGGRKNSGIDRAVIESLPIFRFSSLRGQKDGLECAVCLTRFEPTEVLKLLPKCKHAFHVECVDTWLDAHSTCPLCRYRVDPEDILLIEDAIGNNSGSNNQSDSNSKTIFLQDDNQSTPSQQQQREQGQESGKDPDFTDIEIGRAAAEPESSTREFRRVSGRHSSAGERASGFLSHFLVSHRRSGGGGGEAERDPASSRRSLDGSSKKKRSDPSLAIGCFDRPYRKDGLLLTNDRTEANMARFEHRIVVSSGLHNNRRWSDVQPSDLLYVRSEMIISDSRRLQSVSGCRSWHQNVQSSKQGIDASGGRSVINSRSVSEITSVNRYSGNNINGRHNHRQRHAGVAVSRWLAWISSQSRPAVHT